MCHFINLRLWTLGLVLSLCSSFANAQEDASITPLDTTPFHLDIDSDSQESVLVAKKVKKKKSSDFGDSESENSEEEVRPRSKRKFIGLAEANPLGFVLGVLNVDLLFKLADRFAIGPSLGYMGFGLGFLSFGGVAEIYLQKDAFEALFIRGAGYYGSVTFLGAGFSVMSIHGMVGYRWLFNKIFTVAVGGGLAYYVVSLSSYSPLYAGDTGPSLSLSGVGLALLANIGIAF